jgi:hypothetical protein
MVDLYGTFTCLVHTHMWDVYLHHIQIQNISNISMSDAQNLFYMLEGCHIAYVFEYQWVLICLRYIILMLIMFSLI